jgi:hypothetical protein
LFLDTKDGTADDIAQDERARQQLGYFLPERVIETMIVEDECPGSPGRESSGVPALQQLQGIILLASWCTRWR